jgi:malate dehydrogenase (oxaloacetate-decarboxylating)(NADP+)
MMLDAGDVDMMVSGLATHYADPLRTILQVVGPAPGIRRVASHYLVLLPKDVLVLADCAVNVDPDEDELAEIAILAATTSRALGMEPRIAMLSFSNYGSVDHPRTRKVRRSVEIARRMAPDLEIDGEMQLATALDARLRSETFPFSQLRRDANVLVFPDLQSGNLALQLLQYRTEAVAIGPLLMGTRLPAHALQYGLSAEDVVHLTTLGVVEAAAARGEDGAHGSERLGVRPLDALPAVTE